MRLTLLERAFELAGTGQFGGAHAIAQQLMREGYMDVRRHFEGHALRQQLRRLCAKSRESHHDDGIPAVPGELDRDV